MDNILVYYVDEKAPTFTMQKLTGGIIAVIVVVSLIVIGGLLVIVSAIYFWGFILSWCACSLTVVHPFYFFYIVLPRTATEGHVQQSTGWFIYYSMIQTVWFFPQNEVSLF